jgi:hypothetical protein
MKNNWSFLILGWLMFSGPALQAEESRLGVEHQHALKKCKGELVFKDDKVEYVTANKKHARVWKYQDIQQLGLLDPKVISVLTYEDQKYKFGKDRGFRFQVTKGEVSPALWTFLQARLTKPLVSAVFPQDIAPKYQIPVKHQRGLSGTQGVLEISDLYIAYKTDAKKDSRIWRYEDISSIGTTGPYQLRLTSMDRVEGEYGGERNFVFDLKEKLNQEACDFIWWKLNGPKISAVQP